MQQNAEIQYYANVYSWKVKMLCCLYLINYRSLHEDVWGDEWSAQRPGHITPRNQFRGSWVRPEAILDKVEWRKYVHTLGVELRSFSLQFAVILSELLAKLRGLSPRANYTDRAAAACRRS
jgi:hypothetical protein